VTLPKPKRAKQLGVTDAEYERLLAAQGGHCALCPNVPKTRRLHVDHDHATRRVRGLLCYRCNRALPNYVTAKWLRRAAVYVGGDTEELRHVYFDLISRIRGDA
jgi:Recombination endonuclease VII